MSHDKGFLRLLWDKIDQKLIKSFALQTGAPGVTTITPYDIPGSTQPRHVTERMKIEEFIEGEPHELSFIRSRLRTVCEDFYRKGDPGLFGEAATLDQIIRALNDANNDHPFKGALEDLKDINAYSRVENHAEINGESIRRYKSRRIEGVLQSCPRSDAWDVKVCFWHYDQIGLRPRRMTASRPSCLSFNPLPLSTEFHRGRSAPERRTC